MPTFAPGFTITAHITVRELHWSAEGLRNDETLAELQKALTREAKAFVDDRKDFRVLGDLRNFTVLPRDLAEKTAFTPGRFRAVRRRSNSNFGLFGAGETAISSSKQNSRMRIFREQIGCAELVAAIALTGS